MKNLTNNQVNSILFVKSGEDLSDVQSVVLRQLGSDKEITIPASVVSEDCFTTSISITLGENELANASYLIKIIDSTSSVLFTTTVSIDGNTDEIKAYLIIDD